MPIVLSKIKSNNIQADGRSVVREQHTDDVGQVYFFDYMAEPKFDIDARLQEHAQELNIEISTRPTEKQILEAEKLQIDQTIQQLTQRKADIDVVLMAVNEASVEVSP